MKKVWIHRSNSFKEADSFDEKYYSDMNSAERLETVQFLREAKIYQRHGYFNRA